MPTINTNAVEKTISDMEKRELAARVAAYNARTSRRMSRPSAEASELRRLDSMCAESRYA